MKTLKEHIANGAMVQFTHYQNGELWYIADSGFEFPVPVADAGNGKFCRADRAILFMRYIRKHMEAIEAGKQG